MMKEMNELNSQEISPDISEQPEQKIEINFIKKTFILFGRTGSGKTNLLFNLLQKSKIPKNKIILFSPTFHKQTQEFKRFFIGAELIQNDFIDYDYSLIKNKCVVFDDLGRDLLRSKNFEKLLINKRHWNNCIFFLAQFMRYLPPSVHANYDYAFVFPFNDRYSSEIIYKTFFQQFFQTLNDFIEYGRGIFHSFIITDQICICKAIIIY